VLAKLWPIIGRACVVAKREVFYFFPACALWGTLFIDRSKKDEALHTINTESKAINERKVIISTFDSCSHSQLGTLHLQSKILFFCEGTRNPNTESLMPFKKGPFHVAINAQSTIQPVVVSRYTLSDFKVFGQGKAIIKILPEVNVSGFEKKDIEEIIAMIQKSMQQEYEILNAVPCHANKRNDTF